MHRIPGLVFSEMNGIHWFRLTVRRYYSNQVACLNLLLVVLTLTLQMVIKTTY